MVRVRSVSKSFAVRAKGPSAAKKKIEALKNVSLEALPGQVYGLLGPNGAGKTTMLRAISTLLVPDAGQIEVLGQDIGLNPRQTRASIGFLTSDMKLTGALSPRELLHFFGALNHLPKLKIQARIAEMADYLKMADFLDRPVEKLSTGQKQKTSIAVSLIHDPAIILFDEPSNGLDILAAKTVIDFLKDCKTQGKTVILSTHIMAEAEKLCDRVGIILEGELLLEGTIPELCAQTGKSSLEEVFFDLASTKGMV